MQKLKKLIHLIGIKGKKHVIAFEKQTIKPGKELTLFQGINSSIYSNDHTAARVLYQSKPEDTRYIILKSRLEEKLINYLLYIDLTESNQQKERNPKSRCELQLYQARMLIGQGEYQISERILKKAIRTAKDYEYTFILVESLGVLLELYSSLGMVTSYEKIIEEYSLYGQILNGERKATLLYQQAQQKLSQSKTEEDLMIFIIEVTVQLQQLWQQHLSFICFDLYYRLHMQQLELSQGYGQMLVLTTLADEFVRDLKINKKRFDYKHNLALRLYASLRMGEVQNGLQLARQNQVLYDAQSKLYHIFFESYFLLALHSGNYILAWEVYKQVEKKSFSKKGLSFMEEKWNLYKSYVEWMMRDDKKIVVLEESVIKQTLSTLRKDKQGYNIAILIMQFCQHLYFNQKDVLEKKGETYKKYLERHMNSAILSRERLFFLLILLIIRHDFQYEQISKKSGRLIKRLNQSVLPGGAVVSKIEIVPYIHLWQSIHGILAKKTKEGSSCSE